VVALLILRPRWPCLKLKPWTSANCHNHADWIGTGKFTKLGTPRKVYWLCSRTDAGSRCGFQDHGIGALLGSVNEWVHLMCADMLPGLKQSGQKLCLRMQWRVGKARWHEDLKMRYAWSTILRNVIVLW
jgi:hypothetical protein